MSEVTPEGGGGNRLYCEIDGMRVELDASDLSSAGLFVQTTAMLEADADVEIYLRTPAGQVHTTGVVVQAITYERAVSEGRKPGFGLLFSDLSDAQREVIERSTRLLAASKAAVCKPIISMRAGGGAAGSRVKAARKRTAQASGMPPVSNEAKRTLEKLEATLGELRGRAPWAVLGVEPGATVEAAKAAYFAASKRYHPHVYARFDSDDITRVVTEIFIAHKRAFNSIELSSNRPVDAGPCASPDGASLRPRGASSMRPRKRQQSDVVSLVKEGMRCLAAQRFADAEHCFTRALDKQEDEAQAALWLQLCRGRRATADGEPLEAAKHYRAALEVDPHNKEAQHGAAAGERNKKGGFFGRLFKAGSG